MKKVLFKGKKNNSGSTIVIVLLMTSFVLILSTLITTTTLINLKMKMASSQSSKSFYTAEEAVDEVRASLGTVSVKCFNKAYENKMTKIISTNKRTADPSGETEEIKDSDIDNDTANIQLREEYTLDLLTSLDILPSASFKLTDVSTSYVLGKRCDDDKLDSELSSQEAIYRKFIKRLNDAIEDKAELESKGKTLEIVSVSSLDLYKDGTKTGIAGLSTYTVQFKDCVVKYLDDANGNYSYVTFDGSIGMPDIKVDFKEDEMVGTLFFANYSVVGNSGISVLSGSAEINGSAYAGGNKGLVVGEDKNSSAKLTTSGDYLVCGGNITLGGTKTDRSSLVSSSQIWANNINVNSFVDVTFNGSVNLQDDLEVNGEDSKVHINNSFYGFGYEGVFTGTEDPKFSSSVIVNGKKSSIDFSSASYKLYVAGRAYIKPENDKALATGESLSVNVRQELYLIPSSLLAGAKKNPVKYHKGNAASIELNITPKNFFAYYMLAKNADGSIAIEYRDDPIGDDDYNRYYYFKFNSNSEKNEYANVLLNYNPEDDKSVEAFNKYLNNIYSAHSSEIGNKTIFINYAINFATNVHNTIAAYATSSGSELTYSSNDVFSSNTMSDAEMTAYSTDRGCRYNVLNKILAPLTKGVDEIGYKDGDIQKDLSTYKDPKYLKYVNINLNRYTLGDVFGNIINMGETGFIGFTEGVTEVFNKSVGGDVGNVVVSNDDIIIDGTTYPVYGLVICSGNVTVDCEFDGVILSNKTVKFSNGSSVKNSKITDDKLQEFFDDGGAGSALSQNGILLRDIFRYWNSKTVKKDGSLTVDSMTYRDMVGISQWRKYYDEEKYTE